MKRERRYRKRSRGGCSSRNAELVPCSGKCKVLIGLSISLPTGVTCVFVLATQVHAKHEEKSENRSVYREYNREFLLPKGTNPEQIRSSLSKDGILTIEAPLPALEAPNRERTIPIDKK